MNKHFLLRVIRIQEIDLFFTGKGFAREFIFTNIIYPHFFISRRSYYNFLNLNAKKDLKDNFGLEWKSEMSKYKLINYTEFMADFETNMDSHGQLYLDLMKGIKH